MEDQHSLCTHYAILIGINAYTEKPLNACVQDVKDVKTCLEGMLNSVHIQMLTAAKITDPESSSPIEDPVLWPTYENVVSAFETTTSLAQPGDFVYVHYSGHGTRGEPDSEFSNRSTGDLALVLPKGENSNHESYLWGSTLASLLKAMVDKGLAVTLVLDCCFSASVSRRGDPDVRYLPYDPEIGSKYPPDLEKDLEDAADHPASRDASMRSNWLVNPDGYAILAACGPQEVAVEPKFDGQRHGALSYYLFKTLTEFGGHGKKHKDIYDHLRAKFQKSGLRQHPVLYGNKDQGFFGHTESEVAEATVPIIVNKDDSLKLQAGQAHGVFYGDQFALHPLGRVERIQQVVIATVVHVRALTADLKGLDMTPIRIQTGWSANSLTRLALRNFPVQIDVSLPSRDDWMTALRERSLEVPTDMDEHPSFHVVLNDNNEYEILNRSHQKVTGLPFMSQNQREIGDVCDIIEHLARFELVRELANNAPADSFRTSFDVHIISREESFQSEHLIESEDNEKLDLIVENKGNKDLYLYFYNLGSCWQVENILRGSYEVLPPRDVEQGFTGKSKKKARMKFPPELRDQGQRQCEDIIKVFVTSQPTSFDFFELPKLSQPVEKDIFIDTTRRGSYLSEDWVALNFPIRTSLR